MIDAHAQAETTPTDVVLDPDPPQNPSDIRVELSVIQKIANVGGFCDEEYQLLVKHLPSMLLPYYLKLAQKLPSEVPTAKERDACLSEAVTLFQAATDFLHEHQWLQRMLVAQELRWRSQELVVPRHHVCEDAASEASKVIKDELKAIPDRLAKLANDPVFGSLDKWTIVGVNTAKPEVALLADSIT
ncbi:MAG: hypothetical protein ACR2PG_07785, partial [Hyphomicrobiaceae bacterium]